MAKQVNRLTTPEIRGAMKSGMHPDGGGLYLQVTGAAKSWIYRYTSGKTRYLGLGAYPTVSLADARTERDKAKKAIQEGHDPIEARRLADAPKPAVVTFRDAVDDYISAHAAGWRNPKHRAQWRSTLDTYCQALLNRPVEEIDTLAIKAALKAKVETRRGTGELWTTLPETASRVRGRIEAVLDAYNALNHRSVLNPARWKGHLQHILPPRKDIERVEHHAALPWAMMPDFMAKLRERTSMGALALRFVTLTACRTGEAIGATWAEIDWTGALWTIPAGRMKGKKEHRVPLTEQALAVLREALVLQVSDNQAAPIFAGQDPARGLSNMTMTIMLRRLGHGDLTVHGFRSTFRDWCAEATAYPRELAEVALAHAIGGKTEAAYQRGDLLDKRRQMMTDWASFATTPPAGAIGPHDEDETDESPDEVEPDGRCNVVTLPLRAVG